jgi:DNA-directed RNA polymerase specialized sigma24 family protein
MSESGSVSSWIGRLKSGEHEAAQRLWEDYFQRLVGLARKKLQGVHLRASDPEDVALSAFASFCLAAERGRYPQLLDRHDLWHLLVVITARKVSHQREYEAAQKRNPPTQAAGRAAGAADEEARIDEVLSREPTPEFAAQLAEEYQRLLNRLEDDQLRAIAVWKTEGYTNVEIATQLGRSTRRVEQKLRLIRDLLEEELAS